MTDQDNSPLGDMAGLSHKPSDCCEARQVCAEAYQLVGTYMDIIPNADKWLDNLAEHRLVHKDLLPVSEPEDK